MGTKVEVDVGGTTYEVGSLVEFRNSVEDKLGMRFAEDGELLDELEKRLMPEDMEWPKFYGVEPVRFGDRVMRESGMWMGSPVDQILFHESGEVELCGDGNVMTFSRGELVRRAVVAADGELIEPGQTVWLYGGKRLEVDHIGPDGVVVDCCGEVHHPENLSHKPNAFGADGEPIEAGQVVYDIADGASFRVDDFSFDVVICTNLDDCESDIEMMPSQLTHERPVLDADGVPIRNGDIVYLLPGEWCGNFPCVGYRGGEKMKVDDIRARHQRGGVECHSFGNIPCYPQPSQLSHERPDSWERIEADAKAWVNPTMEERVELVRRCKALAGAGK